MFIAQIINWFDPDQRLRTITAEVIRWVVFVKVNGLLRPRIRSVLHGASILKSGRDSERNMTWKNISDSLFLLIGFFSPTETKRLNIERKEHLRLYFILHTKISFFSFVAPWAARGSYFWSSLGIRSNFFSSNHRFGFKMKKLKLWAIKYYAFDFEFDCKQKQKGNGELMTAQRFVAAALALYICITLVYKLEQISLSRLITNYG